MHYTLRIDNENLEASCEIEGEDLLRFCIEDREYEVSAKAISANHLHLVVNGKHLNAFLLDGEGGKNISLGGRVFLVEDAEDMDSIGENGSAEEIAQEITPPMPSAVVRILVKEGEMIAKGEGVIVVSAMKMETTLTAPFDGRVIRINVKEGEQVAVGQILVDLEALAEED
ncbi:acetyl-CoA carboxylase biotin carboxyl carrier protein subunit [Desulfococcaceae bacterium OttesenSCG-928-F15]|nr:acetyl-CoA carboxylase biotin carboxyl carrier protein subunit [Desulfococcaceae bacterium OttesenSCG-928-F15]